MPNRPGPPREPGLRMGELLDGAPCGFLSFGDDGRIEHINTTLLEMLGSEEADAVGRHVETILSVGARIFYQTHWFPLLRLHGRADEIFLTLRSAEGEEIGVLVNAVRRERDDRSAYDCILMRVRERKKYEDELLRARREAERAHADLAIASEELRASNETLLEQAEELEAAKAAAEEANQAKSTFLAVMSHELRTPLNAIAGYTELIEIGIHGPVTDAQAGALARIKRSQRHLLRLINDVLNLARIEAGHVDYQIADLPLAGIVDDITPLVEPQLTSKGLSFAASIPGTHVVRADEEKTQQIVLNLLSNAIKFTPTGGRITVDAMEAEDVAGMVGLAVTDTGIGIPAEKLRTVFEPFTQVDVSRTSRKEGTGLGLAISRDLALGMGGDLRVRSHVGVGSTFTLFLPRSGLPDGRAAASRR